MKTTTFLSITLYTIQTYCAISFSLNHPFHHLHQRKYDQLYRDHSTSSLVIQNKAAQSDDDFNQYEYYRPQSRGKPQGGDMAYSEENVRRSAETFKAIRKIGGVDCTNDVYARGRNRFEYWYIGKIARTTGTITLNQGIARVWNLLEEHACRLRPIELGREYGNLEIWCSKKGDTELTLSQAIPNDPATEEGRSKNEEMSLIKMEKYVEGGIDDQVSSLEVGFIAEVVTNMGQGFYIVRDDRGQLMQ